MEEKNNVWNCNWKNNLEECGFIIVSYEKKDERGCIISSDDVKNRKNQKEGVAILG